MEPMMQFFAYAHLPEHLQAVSKPFGLCRSNGGGVHAGFSESGRDTKVLRRLEALGFVQGKSGRASVAVHTRDGLKYWKENFRVEIRPGEGK